ncbi:hypothetical protein AAFF_G00221090 [Aldrovandia affinis]|uniref:Uncharacterized protein n=1 Tax=Aldrovandia affinis TaxID=143900 RepID=A0AAD7RFR7_9TELE|nr:hypothetical protein AAFF_G00221090 [Aldrovandia affinis]
MDVVQNELISSVTVHLLHTTGFPALRGQGSVTGRVGREVNRPLPLSHTRLQLQGGGGAERRAGSEIRPTTEALRRGWQWGRRSPVPQGKAQQVGLSPRERPRDLPVAKFGCLTAFPPRCARFTSRSLPPPRAQLSGGRPGLSPLAGAPPPLPSPSPATSPWKPTAVAMARVVP